MIPVFLAVVPVYLIVTVGSLLRKTRTMKPEADAGIMNVAVHVLMPCLILDKMIGAPAMKEPSTVFTAMGLGFGIIATATAISYFTGGLFGLKKGTGKRTFAVSTGTQNYGYLVIPIIAALFPDDGALAVMFVHNMGVELAVWTISVMLLSGNFSLSPKLFLKGPIIAVALGIFINFTHLDSHVPDTIHQTLSMLGACAIPIALLLIGTSLYDLWGKEKINWRVCGTALLLRSALLPALILLVALLTPLPLPLKQVLLAQASVPAGMFSIILARHYKGRVGIAVQVVLTTSILSIITIPVLIFIGMKVLGFSD